MIISTSRFLPQLSKQFEAAGGELVSRKINDLQELSGFDVIVNCTGLGANQLVGDNTVQPLRGQMRPGSGRGSAQLRLNAGR